MMNYSKEQIEWIKNGGVVKVGKPQKSKKELTYNYGKTAGSKTNSKWGNTAYELNMINAGWSKANS